MKGRALSGREDGPPIMFSKRTLIPRLVWRSAQADASISEERVVVEAESGERMGERVFFLHEGRCSGAVFGVRPRAQFSANSFAGWLLVSDLSGLRISVLLGYAWREQFRQPLRHLSPAREGGRVCRPKYASLGCESFYVA